MSETLEMVWEPGKIVHDVLFGRHEHLFLAQGAHRSMDLATGALSIPEMSFTNFRTNVSRRAALATELGARYMHVIFPDKQSVLPREYPLERFVSIGDLYREKSNDVSQNVFFASDALAKRDGVFKKVDTHLTDLGTLLITFELIRRLGYEVPEAASELLLPESFAEGSETGDLGGKLAPPISAKERHFSRKQRLGWLHNEIMGGNNGIVDIRYSPDAFFSDRLLFFGDSFGRDCVRFLSFFFRQTAFLRTPFCHDEMARIYQPDIMVTENVERYLDNVALDSSRDLFVMMPYLSELEYHPGAQFARAFSAEFSYGLDKYYEYIAAMERDFPRLASVAQF